MDKHQEWEASWWGNCANTFHEEKKQMVYAKYMGLRFDNPAGPGPQIDAENKTILDVGGGPVSLLLKTKNLKSGMVVDPCDYPEWVSHRYNGVGIGYIKAPGEELIDLHDINTSKPYDEVWIYNVLQHVVDPAKIVRNMRMVSRVIRVFEWVEAGTSMGHPHNLHETELDTWLGGKGVVEHIAESGAYGDAYFGIFKGDYYEEV